MDFSRYFEHNGVLFIKICGMQLKIMLNEKIIA